MTTYTVSEAKTHFPEIVRNANKRWQRYIVTKNGKPMVILLSVAEWEGILETLEIMRDKRLVAKLKHSLAQVRKGEVYSFQEVVGRKQMKVSK